MKLTLLLAWVLVPTSISVHASSTNGSLFSLYQSQSQDTENDILQHNATIQADLSQRPIQGVRKMTDDEGEKFFWDYWNFDFDETGNSANDLAKSENLGVKPRLYPLSPSLPLNLDSARLFRRDFKCPTDTSACTAINRPNSCCSTGDTCELVQDTGLGDVGCCPQGQTCSGVVGSCQQGYTSCPASMGGGCCIPGYECVSGGCAYIYTVTVTMQSTVMVSTTTQTAPSSSSSSSSITTESTTSNLVPPARPTDSLTTTTTSKSSATGSICPTGFYACSAFYQGGCCRTGRDCDTTSCPAIASLTITSDGITIVVPAETTAAVSSAGQCASGWFSCADTVGGGCCPTGFACGLSCTAVATASTTGTVAKTQPGNDASRINSWEKVRRMLVVSVLGMMWIM